MPTTVQIARRLEELATEIAVLRAAIDEEQRRVARQAAHEQDRQREKNLAWSQRRGEAMREMLAEPSSGDDSHAFHDS